MDLDWHRLARFAEFKATRLSQVSGVSIRTLQRHFRTQYGLTVSEWLKKIRLQEAGELIKSGHRVKQVAMDLGYKQLSHFSREFKRAYGFPPRSAIRESASSFPPHLPGTP